MTKSALLTDLPIHQLTISVFVRLFFGSCSGRVRKKGAFTEGLPKRIRRIAQNDRPGITRCARSPDLGLVYYISIVCQKYHPSEQMSGEVPTNIFYFNIEMPTVNLYGERFSRWYTILFAQLG